MTSEAPAGPKASRRFQLADVASLRTLPSLTETRGTLIPLLGSLLFILFCTLLAYAMAMGVPFSHDEHQFVAGGWLAGQFGLLPYRDFPFHHVPNLLFPYAVVVGLSSSPLWNARVLSALLGGATVAVFFVFSWKREVPVSRFMLGAMASLLLVLHPLFEYTNGRAWNHALPTFFVMAAYAAHLAAARRPHWSLRWGWSGLLLGLAVGSRLTYLLAIFPFLIFISLTQQRPFRVRPTVMFLIGFAASLLPTAALFLLAPDGFIYGNLTYQLLNTDYREALGTTVAMDLAGKLAYFGDSLTTEPSQVLLLGMFLLILLAVVIRRRSLGTSAREEFWLAAGTAAFLGLGALLPTPAWLQYFYAPVPFVALGLAIYLYGTERGYLLRKLVAILLLAAVVGLRKDAFSSLGAIADPRAWVPAQLNSLGAEVAARAGPGRLLSLAPIVAIEGGLDFYPELVGGSFDWRVAGSLSAEERAVLRVLDPRDLEARLAAEPPAAILTGLESGNEGFSPGQLGGLEQPLVDYAVAHGYQPELVASPFSATELTLWLPAARSAD